MSATIAASPGDVRSRRTFGRKLKAATWQYGICAFGGMSVVVVYTVVKRFPELGAAAAALIVCGLLVLALAWLYARMKHLSSQIDATFMSIKPERYAWRLVVEIGTEIVSALQAFRQIIK